MLIIRMMSRLKCFLFVLLSCQYLSSTFYVSDPVLDTEHISSMFVLIFIPYQRINESFMKFLEVLGHKAWHSSIKALKKVPAFKCTPSISKSCSLQLFPKVHIFELHTKNYYWKVLNINSMVLNVF